MRFTKMHGLGNDYLYFYGDLKNPEEWSRKLSDRHFGIGSDGIITISSSDSADFKMRIFNADGSEAMMCGNGIRCVGKYVYDKGYTDKKRLKIETLSGEKVLSLQTRGGKVTEVAVSMGKSVVESPVTLDTVYGKVTPVSMGNPHAVTFVENAEDAPLTTVGKALEHHPYFKNGVNVEFVQVIDRNTLRMRVWERGSGFTGACGTGACAAVAAGAMTGRLECQKEITVRQNGGNLTVQITDGEIYLTGRAQTVFEGETELPRTY